MAKNYLTEEEIARLNRLVTCFLDDLEDRTADHVLTSMRDCADALDGFLRYARRDVLEGRGTRTHAQAKKKALEEFAKFQKVQDATFENDFEREMRRIEGRQG